MPEQTLAQRVRAKYPGAYDDLSDQQLEIAVQQKFPGVYNDIPKTPYKTARTEDFTPSTTPEGSAAGRFASNAGAMLNPVGLVKGLYQSVTHPIDTASQILSASGEQLSKAKQLAGEGRLIEAGGHALGAIPLIGPAAVGAGEQIAQGDIAGGLGTGAGLLATSLIPSAVKGIKGLASAESRAAMAGKLEAGAAERVTDVMAPKVGPNKARFGGMAEKTAPELLKRGDISGFSMEALHEHVGQRLSQSEQALDAAADARLAARSFPTDPMIAALKAKRAQLTAEAVEGSKTTRVVTERTSPILDESGKPITVTESKAQPIGKDVVPSPNAARVAVIDQAIKELQQLGPVTRYDPIRLIRQAYDGPAKAIYSPSMTADFLKAQGGKMGAADVTGVLRDTLAKWDPATAAANADYSLYRTANDVLEASAEVERTRPKVGRAIMARLTGAVAGGHTAGAQGAIAGFVFGPALEAAVGSGATTKLQTAKLMTKLADAIRKGDQGHVASLASQLRRLGAQAAQVKGVTSPSGSQSQTTEPALLTP